MKISTRIIAHFTELAISVAAMLTLVAISLGAYEYNLLTTFAFALLVPVTTSLAVETWRDVKAGKSTLSVTSAS